MNQHTTQPPDALLKLIEQVRESYSVQPTIPQRGRPRTYSGLSFLLLAVAAVALRTFKERELHRWLTRDQLLRHALGFDRVPHRRTVARRMRSLLPEAETQVAALGLKIARAVRASDNQPQTSAIDGRMYAAAGPRWHKKHRQKKFIPSGLRNVDVESSWFKSGYRGWVQGYRLVLQGLVFPAPVPLFAVWRLNSEGESTIAARALEEQSLPITSVLLGDETFGGAELVRAYAEHGGWLLTPRSLPARRRSWKNDLYSYRKETIELLFQRVIQSCDLKACPVKGWSRNGAFVLASVWLYQVIFLSNYRAGRPVAHIKEQLDLARWRIAA
jgi:hypothetical protein